MNSVQMLTQIYWIKDALLMLSALPALTALWVLPTIVDARKTSVLEPPSAESGAKAVTAKSSSNLVSVNQETSVQHRILKPQDPS
jgi:hypothetical protein